MADPTDPDSKRAHPAGNYTIGYKKPPTEHQFKPRHLREGSPKVKYPRTKNAPDVASMIEQPLRVKRGGKTIVMHPFEAELTSLGKRAINGEPRATKLFLKHCEVAGLLNPPTAEQTHGVFVVPRGVNRGILRVLIETCGLPPWDTDIYAALEVAYERDQARIEELHIQFIKDLENE